MLKSSNMKTSMEMLEMLEMLGAAGTWAKCVQLHYLLMKMHQDTRCTKALSLNVSELMTLNCK